MVRKTSKHLLQTFFAPRNELHEEVTLLALCVKVLGGSELTCKEFASRFDDETWGKSRDPSVKEKKPWHFQCQVFGKICGCDK